MLKLSNETEDIAIFKFEGESEIDILKFSNTLKNISNVINDISTTADKDLYLHLKITAIKKGSFEFHLKAIAGFLYALLPNINVTHASQIIKAFCELLSLKQWIADEEIKSITNSDGNVTITKVNGFKVKVENKIVNEIIINNYSNVERSLNNLGAEFPENKKLVIKTKGKEYKYNEHLKKYLQNELSSQLVKEETCKFVKTSYYRKVIVKNLISKCKVSGK